MAIRPADLQLAYMAAPQNAAQLSAAQEAGPAAGAAQASAFAAQALEREQQIAATAHVEAARVRAHDENERGSDRPPRRRKFLPSPANALAADAPPIADEGGDDHLIDVTA